MDPVLPRNYPTRFSCQLLTELEYDWEIVERRQKGGKSKDLFGCIDIQAVHEEFGFLGIQATSLEHHVDRVRKCLEARIRKWLMHGRVEVWSWGFRGRGEKRKMTRRVERIALENLR